MRFNEVKSQEAEVRTDFFVHFFVILPDWYIPDILNTVKQNVFHLSVCEFATGILTVKYIKMYFVTLQADVICFLSIY